MNGRTRATTEVRAEPAAARRTALACMVALAVALGVGRFAFTPLLPLMLKSGALDIQQGGWLASANYAGYFAGALSCAALRVNAARVVRGGLCATVLLVLAMGAIDGIGCWAAVRFAAGIASAWTFVFASQWGLRRLAELGESAWGGLIYTGPGMGIVGTGLFVSVAGNYGAQAGWLGFGLVSAVLSAAVWRVFDPVNRLEQATGAPRRRAAAAACATGEANPKRTPARATPSVAPVAVPRFTTRDATMTPSPRATDRASVAAAIERRVHRTDAAWLVVLYAIPGFGYIITATFLPVIARAALPGSAWPDLFWPMFGIALMAGSLCGARLPAHWDNRTLLAGCYLLQALGIASGIVWPSAAGFASGSVLIGLPFTAITLFAMREARRLHGDDAAGLMGYATAAYGLGQIAGPLAAAPIAARTGSFTLALWLAAGALLAGAIGLVVLVWATRR
ncbi:YbfB/YjiJ family MFS transporter [Paraburkholderia rhizosphaerae]|uniref:Putative MFS-type transporter YbfB n=1 Tax=Paraburkholderia rhizosphaerae TaxID=480658 RepID=A0A4V3HEF9_9BURK|nr:YbfB/YjiJ family MFS transporter [Paraburkholderia rhizosphaerae]TDY47659.1 putative MFS-type transporter YbfB [Paraburkholderia rhizosphaerae]